MVHTESRDSESRHVEAPRRTLHYVAFALSAFVLLVSIEHAGRMNKWAWRPSVQILAAAVHCKIWAMAAGRVLARLSAFLDWLRLNELLLTVLVLVWSVLRLVTSFWWVLDGYLETSKVYQHPEIVLLGSVALVAALVVLAYRAFAPVRRVTVWIVQHIVPVAALILVGFVTFFVVWFCLDA